MGTQRTRSRLLPATVGAVVAMLFAGGVASATIPAAGVINGCYEKRTGLLRVIDAEAGKTCITKYETPISWNADPGPEVASLRAWLADEATAGRQTRAEVTSLREVAASLQSQVNNNRGQMLANDNHLDTRITSERNLLAATMNTELAAKQQQIDQLTQRVTVLEEAMAALRAEVESAKK
jgi:hypothetical protein